MNKQELKTRLLNVLDNEVIFNVFGNDDVNVMLLSIKNNFNNKFTKISYNSLNNTIICEF